eukprot:TRINITY_DN4906_c0_g1_i1.p1 TRINITY_DN4906_c0_g1~~TRINITY_DN4906_c0_g1_i1.p1  ORF type:complete len:891 (-),score=221.72 TRINITY_DN4906_c0_g1_i1:124-2796(-)
MWVLCRPALNLNVDMPVTDEHGSVINIKGENNVCVTMGEVNAKRILFSTTIDEWKKENTSHVHHHHHHLNLSPLHTTNAHNASTPTTTKLLSLITPRLSMLRIYLPNGQLSTTTIWDGSKCLKSVLEEICSKRKISMEGKIARDLNGHHLDLDIKLSDLPGLDITFGNPEQKWNIVIEGDVVPNDGSQTYHEQNVSDTYRSSPQGRQVITVEYNGQLSKIAWEENKTYLQLLSKTLYLRKLRVEDCEVIDADGKKLDWNKIPLRPVDHLKLVRLSSDHASKPLCIYLPKGQLANYYFSPEKYISEVIQELVDRRPELGKDMKVVDMNEKILDIHTTKLSDLQSRAIYYGTNPKEWNSIALKKLKNKSKASHKQKNSSSPSSSSSYASSIAKITEKKSSFYNLNYESSSSMNPTMMTTPSSTTSSNNLVKKIFKIYLPNGQVSVVPFQAEKELGQVLEKACASRLGLEYKKMGIPMDFSNNKLDMTKKIGELNVVEIVFGTNMKNWTLLKCQEMGDLQNYIKHYLKFEEKENSDSNSIFKIYLPGGDISSVPLLREYDKVLREVLERICNTRQGLDMNQSPIIDLKGQYVDIDLTLQELGIKEICFGTDILEWIMYYERNNVNNNINAKLTFSEAPTIQERLQHIQLIKDRLSDINMEIQKTTMEAKLRDNKSSSTSSSSVSLNPNEKRSVNFADSDYKKLSKSKSKKFQRQMSIKAIDYGNLLMNMNSNKQQLDDVIFANRQQLHTSNWHIQHVDVSQLEHLEHYLSNEHTYKRSYTIPFRFVDQPTKNDLNTPWKSRGSDGRKRPSNDGTGRSDFEGSGSDVNNSEDGKDDHVNNSKKKNRSFKEPYELDDEKDEKPTIKFDAWFNMMNSKMNQRIEESQQLSVTFNST